MLGRVRVTWVGAALAAVLLLSASGFLAGAGAGTGASFSPVNFDDTLTTGMTGVDVRQADTEGWALPRAEVFYSQYDYVVGYYGMAALLDEVGAAGATTYGRPLTVFVTDYTGTGPVVTEEGYVSLQNSVREGWVRASRAHFVVDSPARTPAGPAVLPFSERAAAEAFVDRYGGRTISWTELRARSTTGGRSRGAVLRDRVAEHHAWANRTVAEARALRDRPVSVVVGEDAPTLAAAIERAPPNTTVRLPPGNYEGSVNVTKPLTLAGAGNATVVDGGGNGSVLTLRSPRAAVTGLRITGVGDRSVSAPTGEDGGSAWDRRVRLVYGRGDAGVRLADARGSLVEDVTVETSANGVLLLNSSRTAVTNVTVIGSETWEEGFMSVLPMYSRVVVQDSTFRGGRDAVYTHYSDGLVVRNNRMRGMRYGVHEMYTSNALVANNTVRETEVGVILMTRPQGNLVVGNDVRDSGRGVSTVGSTTLVSRNVLADNGLGLSVGVKRSLVTNNTVARNEVGVRDGTLLPSSDVYGNDVVANGQALEVGAGGRDIWTVDGRGNYWGPVPGRDRDGDGVVDRPYRPADAVDSAASRAAGAAVLADSPAVTAMRGFQRSVPGLRTDGIVDTAPLARPVRPGVLEDIGVDTGGEAP